MGKVYFITDGEYIKIGYTSQKIQKRIQQLNTGSISNLYLLGWIEGDKKKESFLHKKFSKERVRFNAEWFRPSEDLIDYINENNLKPNTFVDIIDNEVMGLLSFSQ